MIECFRMKKVNLSILRFPKNEEGINLIDKYQVLIFHIPATTRGLSTMTLVSYLLFLFIFRLTRIHRYPFDGTWKLNTMTALLVCNIYQGCTFGVLQSASQQIFFSET